MYFPPLRTLFEVLYPSQLLYIYTGLKEMESNVQKQLSQLLRLCNNIANISKHWKYFNNNNFYMIHWNYYNNIVHDNNIY